MISDRDVAFYREQGYLVVSGVLEPSRVEVLRRELDAILEGARGVMAHTEVYENQSDASRRYFAVTSDPTEAARA